MTALSLIPCWAELPVFEQRISALANRLSLSLAPFNADHISLRCNTLSTAEAWVQALSHCGEVLSAKEINGRPIYLFTLHQPLLLGHWSISCIELPFPNHKRYPEEGWEHIEFVVPCQPERLAEYVATILPTKQRLDELGLTYKQSAPKAENEGLPNPTIAVSDGITTLKFHPYSIQQVITSEYVD